MVPGAWNQSVLAVSAQIISRVMASSIVGTTTSWGELIMPEIKRPLQVKKNLIDQCPASTIKINGNDIRDNGFDLRQDFLVLRVQLVALQCSKICLLYTSPSPRDRS